MAIALAIVGVAFAAFCVWLTVRIINRRERCAKWTAVGLALVLAYPLSFGPACWLCEYGLLGQKTAWVAYRPLTWLACLGPLRAGKGAEIWTQAGMWIRMYATACGDQRRIKRVSVRDGILFAFHYRDLCRDDSVSPIDYEIEQSGSEDLMGLLIGG
jgi:hypothetical protein